MDGEPLGNLVIIGGAEDKDGGMQILRTFCSMAGGDRARISVVTVATRHQAEAGDRYRALFEGLGAGTVEIIHVTTREDAFSRRNSATILESTGVFFTGGDQLRITSLLGGTPLYAALKGTCESGAIIAGTSAGASAMSAVMIVQGEDEDPPRNMAVRMAPGMGLLGEVVIDQHFAQRGRIGRLLSAISQNPQVLGIGIDEDTAIVVDKSNRFQVIGSNTVTVVDGRYMKINNVSESRLNQPLAMTDVNLHILPAGYGFDLRERKPIAHWRVP